MDLRISLAVRDNGFFGRYFRPIGLRGKDSGQKGAYCPLPSSNIRVWPDFAQNKVPKFRYFTLLAQIRQNSGQIGQIGRYLPRACGWSALLR